MICPGAQYTDLYLDEEFMSSLYRTWAPSIELLKQDHEDLDGVPVDGILSGTSAHACSTTIFLIISRWTSVTVGTSRLL
jgi:hypothetical protein